MSRLTDTFSGRLALRSSSPVLAFRFTPGSRPPVRCSEVAVFGGGGSAFGGGLGGDRGGGPGGGRGGGRSGGGGLLHGGCGLRMAIVLLAFGGAAGAAPGATTGLGVAAGNSRGTQPVTGSSSTPTWAAAGLLPNRRHRSAAAAAAAHVRLPAGCAAARRGCGRLAMPLIAEQLALHTPGTAVAAAVCRSARHVTRCCCGSCSRTAATGTCGASHGCNLASEC